MRSKSAGEPGRVMLALMCILAAVVAAAALFIETVVGWFVFFSPGWANGWPTPWSFQIVLSIGLTSQTLVMLMTAALGFGAILGFICTLLGIRWSALAEATAFGSGSCSHSCASAHASSGITMRGSASSSRTVTSSRKPSRCVAADITVGWVKPTIPGGTGCGQGERPEFGPLFRPRS